jgi:hypothetical protein
METGRSNQEGTSPLRFYDYGFHYYISILHVLVAELGTPDWPALTGYAWHT